MILNTIKYLDNTRIILDLGQFCASLYEFRAILRNNCYFIKLYQILLDFVTKNVFPDGESNPGRRGESAES